MKNYILNVLMVKKVSFSLIFILLLISSACKPQKIGGLDDENNGDGGVSNLQAPDIISFSPTAVVLAGGETLTIRGNYFQSGSTIKIGTLDCLNTVFVSKTTLTCITPAGFSGTFDIEVMNPDSKYFVLQQEFIYKPLPVIDFLSPSTLIF